ncbi:MAG: DUF222 domain-containing protein [Kineosporiaceae bacterium]
MTAGTIDAPAGVATALDDVRIAVEQFRTEVAARARQVPEARLVDAVAGVARLRAGLEAAYLGLVRELTARGPALDPATRVAGTPEGVVRAVTGASPGRARADVAAARAVADDQPLAAFGGWLATGAVSREHVDVAVRVMDRIPAHLAEDPADRQIVADYLRTVADEGRANARDLDRSGRRLLAHLDPTGDRSVDPAAEQRRFLDLHGDATGMVIGRFQLTPVEGAALRAAIAEYSAPVPAEDGTRDPRTPRQRRADSLAAIVEKAMGVAHPRRGERPRIVVHATAEQLTGVPGAGAATTEHGEGLPAWALARLACDAVLQRVVIDPSLGPLDVGREHRLVTLAQRRALAARDGGCVICGAPADWCDAHHVVPWSEGGASDLANYALLCPGHHTAVHAGTWGLTHDPEGRLLFVPPRAVDPARRPRPPTHHLVARTLRGLRDGSPGP